MFLLVSLCISISSLLSISIDQKVIDLYREHILKASKKSNPAISDIIPDPLPMIFLGERHEVLEDKDLLIDLLPMLKEKGLTHLVVEFVRNSEQEFLDQYGKKNRDALFNLIYKEVVKRRLKGVDSSRVAGKYLSVVDTAKKLGIDVIGIDTYLPFKQDTESEQALKYRNDVWVSEMKQIFGCDRRYPPRLLVFAGSFHSGFTNGIDVNETLKKDCGFSSLVIDLAGSDRKIRSSAYPSFREEEIEYTADYLGLYNSFFILKLEAKTTGIKPADYIVHLPRKKPYTKFPKHT